MLCGICIQHTDQGLRAATKRIKSALVADKHRILWFDPDDYIPGVKHKIDVLFLGEAIKDPDTGKPNPAVALIEEAYRTYGKGRGKKVPIFKIGAKTTVSEAMAMLSKGNDTPDTGKEK